LGYQSVDIALYRKGVQRAEARDIPRSLFELNEEISQDPAAPSVKDIPWSVRGDAFNVGYKLPQATITAYNRPVLARTDIGVYGRYALPEKMIKKIYDPVLVVQTMLKKAFKYIEPVVMAVNNKPQLAAFRTPCDGYVFSNLFHLKMPMPSCLSYGVVDLHCCQFPPLSWPTNYPAASCGASYVMPDLIRHSVWFSG
jgi:hypothetical protein